jgi:glutamine synthetase
LPIKIEQHAETLARECAAKAAEAGIPMEDIQEEVGDIQELIASRLEDAVEIDEDVHGDASTDDRAA